MCCRTGADYAGDQYMRAAALSDERAPSLRGRSVPERGAGWDHGGTTGVDGLDDLGVVDALQVNRRDAEVAVAELALEAAVKHGASPKNSRVAASSQ